MKVIYFNPPFCNSVTTNIGKKFLNLKTKQIELATVEICATYFIKTELLVYQYNL